MIQKKIALYTGIMLFIFGSLYSMTFFAHAQEARGNGRNNRQRLQELIQQNNDQEDQSTSTTTPPAEPQPAKPQATTTATTTDPVLQDVLNTTITPEQPAATQPAAISINYYYPEPEKPQATTTPPKAEPEKPKTTATTTATTTIPATTKPKTPATPLPKPTPSKTIPLFERFITGQANVTDTSNYYTPLDNLTPGTTYTLSFMAMILGLSGAVLILRNPREQLAWTSPTFQPQGQLLNQ